MSSPTTNGAPFFEGVEKLLEIWFNQSERNLKNCDLRNIPRLLLENLLKTVGCEIISSSRNDHIDAYVLSESSMFLAKRKFILKTCGRTLPLQCLERLLTLVENHAGFDEIEDIFYSRKNFKKPELQLAPYQDFQQEAEMLNRIFKDGKAYVMGSPHLNHSDCWYLYTLNDRDKRPRRRIEPDQTLEILMSDLDPHVMAIFTRNQSSTAEEATQKSGIQLLIPNMKIDDYLFEPCGYSMNGISKNGSYMTIHITPEPAFSYVSFESNIPQSSYKEVITRVLETFRPGKFVLTVFANKMSTSIECPKELENINSFGDCLRHDIQFCRFNNYDFIYAFYSKFPS